MRSKLYPHGYHKAKSEVCFKYLKIRFTTFKCVSLGFDWKWAHKPTLKTMSGLLAVRYRSGPIMPLKDFSSTDELLSSTANLVEGEMGVPMGLADSISNHLINFFTYFCWCIIVLFEVCLIYKPQKKLSSPIMLISNLLLTNFENSLHKLLIAAPNIMHRHILVQSIDVPPLNWEKRYYQPCPFENYYRLEILTSVHTKP